MRLLLIVGAIIVELVLAILLIGGISAGISQTYAIGAAGYSRLSRLGAILALLFLGILAWLPTLICLAVMIHLPRRWRDEETGRREKIKYTAGAVVIVFFLGSFWGFIGDALVD